MPTLSPPKATQNTRDGRQKAHPQARPNTLESVRYLRRTMGLTEADLAIATGASERTVRRWLSGDALPQARYARRTDDLRAVVEELTDSLTPKGVGQWLRGRNRTLKGRRPIELIGRDEFEAVYEAAQSFSLGYYV